MEMRDNVFMAWMTRMTRNRRERKIILAYSVNSSSNRRMEEKSMRNPAINSDSASD